MPRLVFEGNYQVHWVTTIATVSTPTAAEINAGTEITNFVPKDGVRYGPGFNKVDAAVIADSFDKELQGSWGLDAGLTVQRDDTTNTAADLFTSHGRAGYLVALPQATSSSPANGEKAFVLPAEASVAVPNNTAANALQTVEVDMAITDTPSFNATITT